MKNAHSTLWLLLTLALSLPLIAQDMPPHDGPSQPGQDEHEQDPNTCDMSSAARGLWCEDGDHAIDKKELVDNKDLKAKVCKEHPDKKPWEVEICSKEYYGCEKCGKVMDRPAKCCETKPVRKTDRARIIYRCRDCGAQNNDRKSVEHSKDCKKKGIERVCSKSGNEPHLRPKKQGR